MGTVLRDRVYIWRCTIYGCSVALHGLKDIELELRVEELEKKLKEGRVDSMSKGLAKKLNHLEERILGPVTKETSKLSYYDLPEQKLFDAVHIVITSGRGYEDLTEYERKLVYSAYDRIVKRTYMVFFNYVETAICEDDPVACWMFYGWFGWFMQEARHGVWQFLRESEIYDQKGKKWKQREQEADAFCKKHWRHDLFSEESFKKTMQEWSTEVRLKKR